MIKFCCHCTGGYVKHVRQCPPYNCHSWTVTSLLTQVKIHTFAVPENSLRTNLKICIFPA